MLGSTSVPGKSSHFVAFFVGGGRGLWWYVQRGEHPGMSQRGGWIKQMRRREEREGGRKMGGKGGREGGKWEGKGREGETRRALKNRITRKTNKVESTIKTLRFAKWPKSGHTCMVSTQQLVR